MVRRSSYRLVTEYYLVTGSCDNDAIETAKVTGANLMRETDSLDLESKYESVLLSDKQAESFWSTSIKANEFFK